MGRDFSGSPVIKTLTSNAGEYGRVQSLVGELRSHIPQWEKLYPFECRVPKNSKER